VGPGASYEIICISVFLVTLIGVHRVWKRDASRARELLVVLLVGLFFGVGWEPQGTELVWRYPGYRFYAFMSIPFAIILSWSWWMIVCYVVAERIEIFLYKILYREHWLVSLTSMYISGVFVALVVEPFSVALGYWDYLVVGEKAFLDFKPLGVGFNLTVIIGWGILTVMNLTLSKKERLLTSWLKNRVGLGSLLSLNFACAFLGLFSGWLSWQIVGFFAALVEDAAPRVFFTRDYIFILEGITSAQLIGLLIAALAVISYVRATV
jgi:hypothetical protein